MNTLLKSEIEEMDEVMQEEITKFTVDSLESANWCFRKIRALKAQVTETNSIADAEVSRIETWRKKENEAAESSISYFESLLTEYYRALKEENPKAKLSTPYGKVSSRKQKKWNYNNEEEIINYLTQNGYNNLLKIKQSIDKSNLKKEFKNGVNSETGELIPGIEITNEESISIKVE